MKQPLLVRGGLSDRIFVVVDYETVDDRIYAKKKFDVTDQFWELVTQLTPFERSV